MSKRTKGWLLAATALVLGGALLFACVMMFLGWDFMKLDTARYETCAYTVDETFDTLVLELGEADVVIAPSTDGVCKIESYERTKQKHVFTVQNGVLTMRVEDYRRWYDHIGVHVDSPRVTLYLPQETYTALTVHGNTGRVQLPAGITFGDMDIAVNTGNISVGANATGRMQLKTTTGNISLQDVSASALELSVNTGDISLANVICDTLVADSSTGNVRFDSCDAAAITVKTTTGNIRGTLRSEKVFVTATTTGKVSVPHTDAGGRCELITTTGDIRITII